MKGATNHTLIVLQIFKVSIHAPNEGSDQDLALLAQP